jgi:hypothetical protein
MTMRIALAVVALGSGFAAPCLAAESLVTGVAVYEVGLDPEKGAGVATIAGTMTARLERDCDTYITEAELDADIAGVDGMSLPLRVVSSHSESGASLTFDITTSLADMEVDRASGTATRNGDGISVALKEPEERSIDLKGDVLFPVAMLEAAITAAKAGETFREFRTFDGTGKGEEVWTASVLITPAGEDDESEDDAPFAAGLGFDDLARWRMALSYFPPGSGGEQTPAFSTSMVVYENGFAQAAVYDLGEFAMQLKLIEFRPTEPKPCP